MVHAATYEERKGSPQDLEIRFNSAGLTGVGSDKGRKKNGFRDAPAPEWVIMSLIPRSVLQPVFLDFSTFSKIWGDTDLAVLTGFTREETAGKEIAKTLNI